MQINDGVINLNKYGFEPVAIQETTDNQNVIFWCRVCGDESRNGNTPRLVVLVEDCRSSDLLVFIFLWGKYISYLQ